MTTRKPAPPKIDAPYSLEAEEAVLGGLLIAPELFGMVSAVITASDFFTVRHGYIFEAMQMVSARKEPIDNITLASELTATGNYQQVGGAAYIAQLINNTPNSYNVDIYAGLVKRCAVRRRLLQGSDDMRELAYNESIPLEDVLAGSEKIMQTIRKGARIERGEEWKSIISRVYDRVEGRMNGNAKAFGLFTGFKELDNLMTGLKRKTLTIVGGRPGMGKTAWMLSAGLNQLQQNQRVGFISQEMDKDELAERFIAMAAMIDGQGIRTGMMPDNEWKRFVSAIGRVSDYPFEVCDIAGMTVKAIRGKALEWMNYNGLDALYIDYLQIIKPDEQYRGNRTNEVSAIARELKELASELNIPVIAAAQINRGVESRDNKRPQLSDLRESGEIESAADNVLFPYREDYYLDASEQTGDTELILAKQRNGPLGSAWAKWYPASTRYVDGHLDKLDLLKLQGWTE
jgi:replicative DNA helicase